MKNIRPEIEFKQVGGLFDVFDNAIKSIFNITDPEYDFICENATNEELDLFLGGIGSMEKSPTFTEKRKSLEIRNKYLNEYRREGKSIRKDL